GCTMACLGAKICGSYCISRKYYQRLRDCRIKIESAGGQHAFRCLRATVLWPTASLDPDCRDSSPACWTLPSPLLDDQTLHAAAEIATSICKPRHREASAFRADPALRVEQNPFTDRFAGHADREVGVEKGPVLKIDRGRGAVAEIGRDHRTHRL